MARITVEARVEQKQGYSTNRVAEFKIEVPLAMNDVPESIDTDKELEADQLKAILHEAENRLNEVASEITAQVRAAITVALKRAADKERALEEARAEVTPLR